MRMLHAAAFAAFVFFLTPGAALGQTAPGTVLSINAEGRSEARPDMATISVGVETVGQTAQTALAENTLRMNALTQALRRQGIAERDIQTAYVSVSPQHRRNEAHELEIVGHEASNSVRVRVRDLANTGRIIEAVVAAGGNTINGISFSHQDPEPQLDSARRDAIAEARRRAELYADALGLRVTRVVSVTEAGAARPGVESMVLSATLTTDGLLNELPQIVPGEIEARTFVSVSFELR